MESLLDSDPAYFSRSVLSCFPCTFYPEGPLTEPPKVLPVSCTFGYCPHSLPPLTCLSSACTWIASVTFLQFPSLDSLNTSIIYCSNMLSCHRTKPSNATACISYDAIIFLKVGQDMLLLSCSLGCTNF